MRRESCSCGHGARRARRASLGTLARSAPGRGLALVMAGLTLGGCYTHQMVRRPATGPTAAMEALQSSDNESLRGIAEVVLDDGSKIAFVDPVLPDADGMLRGEQLLFRSGQRLDSRAVEISYARVREVVLEEDERKLDTVSILLAVGLTVAAVAGLAIAIDNSWDDVGRSISRDIGCAWFGC